MSAAQRKTRAAVIEPLHAPSHGGMALAAIGAEIAPVGIVVAVALDARRRRAVVAFARMTRHTSRIQMRAHERKLRVRMVEADLAPAFVGVARAATYAQAAPVRLVGAVAIHASARRLAIFLCRQVARRASHALVRAVQRIVGGAVIESRGGEPHQDCTAPLVIGVARTARRRRGVAITTVKACVGGDVGADRAVTGSAQLVLRIAVKRRVTGVTAALEICMPRRQRPRRNKALDHGLGVCSAKCQHCRASSRREKPKKRHRARA